MLEPLVATHTVAAGVAAARALVTAIVLLAGVAACGSSDIVDGASGPTDAGSGPTAEVTSSGPVATLTEGEMVEVDRVIDGDSLELLIGGEEVEVRLLGINAPELYTLDDEESCNGQAARDHLRLLIADTTSIRFVADVEDRFGRTLGVLLLDGRAVTTSMVEAGWALALWSGDDPALTESMKSAAAAGAGMWGTRCGEPQSIELTVIDWQMDPPGDDRAAINDEWVVIVNGGTAPVDLDGWMIRDETTTNRYRISGYTLAAGEELRFRSGTGSDGGGDVYLGSKFPVWSNKGETILLADPEGRLAAHAFVDG